LEQDEKRLVERAQAGDLDAFGELYERFSPAVFNVALRMVGSREDAEDIRQEVFLRAHRALKEFKGEARFSTWLYRIAANVALDEIRRRKPTVSADALREESRWEAAAGERGDPQEQLDRNLAREAVQAALLAMPPHYRILVVLKHIEGLSYEEIASVLGCSLTSLNVRLHRARESFRKALAPRLDGLEESESDLPRGPKKNLALY
jgi:RNA polymerase sigma-70 factor (ECF subfamily)